MTEENVLILSVGDVIDKSLFEEYPLLSEELQTSVIEFSKIIGNLGNALDFYIEAEKKTKPIPYHANTWDHKRKRKQSQRLQLL